MRHPSLGRIDRDTVLRFVFDGVEYTGHPGDTLASALLANGVRRTGTSVKLGRPRGIVSAGAEEPCAVVQIEQPYPEPMLPATTVELYDGLVAGSLAGRGRLADGSDQARYDAVHAHCEVLVVGAGPAGSAAARLAAARIAVRAGVRVILADERPPVGPAPTLPPAVRLLTRTTVFGYYDHNYLVAVQRRTNHLGAAAPAHRARERIWHIRAGRVILATGAHEQPIAFAGNDRPGVMLAGAARAYLDRYGVVAGRRAVVFTNDDGALLAARELAAAGVAIVAVVDPRADGAVVTGTGAGPDGTLSTVEIGGLDGRRPRSVEADLLLVSGGWNPVLQLYGQAGGRVEYDQARGVFLPAGCAQPVEVAGSARGLSTVEECEADGIAAARRALAALGVATGAPAGVPVPEPVPPVEVTDPPFFVVPAEDYSTHFVDLQRDVTIADLNRATGAGLRSVEHVKRYTTAGTAHDQGKTSGALTAAVVAGLTGGGTELTTFRPPYTPVSFAALAGRDRGQRYDPVRVTAMHDWHVAHGAVFENAGQWKRAWYYPRDGESMEQAVLRECGSVRTGVSMMDVSTLGKVEVCGPDAGEFLDRMYTNTISTLKVGSIRYGVMCGLDGMVLDDGTVSRLAPDRYLVTTTTGNAALVLDWMAEWLQTEWTRLRVYCTSVSDQWATTALVGPGAREVLGRLAPELAVDAASFPYLTWRAAQVAGLPARVCRISFSGELAYEISVAWWHGLALWEAVYAAGATPYGTEAMHVLRAEKGYPIVGQETDGSVTPHDLGMAWVVSTTKRDFIGKRSFARPDTARADRKHLVGLLPDDPALRLPEGAAVVDGTGAGLLGHVTSSYRSAALGRTFALGLVRSGRDRVGQRLWATMDDALVPVAVSGPVFYDPEGTRRDG
jgi:sarcosine oxidase, subunit alpha